MSKGTISFGGILQGQGIHRNLQWLMYQAGIDNGVMSGKDFIDAIKGVPLDGLRDECRRDVEAQLSFAGAFSRPNSEIVIENFEPDPQALDAFVDITFKEMRGKLEARRQAAELISPKQEV